MSLFPASVRRQIFLVRSFLRIRRNQLGFRIAGIPTAIRHLWRRNCNSAATIRIAYMRQFWRPRSLAEVVDIALALLLWPAVLLALSMLFLWKNGRAVAVGSGRSLTRQFVDHLRLYVAAGVLPTMYYVYELDRRPLRRHARTFLFRNETKGGVFHLVNREQRRPDSVVSDKVVFAEHLRNHGLPTVPTLAVFEAGQMIGNPSDEDLRIDLFVKPVVGKGGRGGQRWDYLGRDMYRSAPGVVLSRDELFDRWLSKSTRRAFLLQPRINNHPDLLPLNNGALSTVRVLTCLDECDRPEIVGAIMRMAVGSNRVVDNAHAGGIAAAVDLPTGTLSAASNLGTHAGLGWAERHPTSGAQIAGVRLPCWQELRELVLRAHSTLQGAVVIGWDVAIAPEGPLVIEANGGPGLEIMQRANRQGFGRGRLGDLLAHHIARRAEAPRRMLAA